MSGADARTWTEAASGRQIEADFLALQDDSVKLRMSDGREVSIVLSRLSAADQEFAKTQAASAPPAARASSGVASGEAAASGADWPTWRGANRDGISPDTGLLKSWPKDGPELLWTYENAGKGYSAPAIVGGRFYTLGARDGEAMIICLDAESGEEIWAVSLGEDPEKGYNTGWGAGPRSAPSVSDGMVYALGMTGDLVCVSAEDGKKVWSKNLLDDFDGKTPSWGYSESPLVDGDKILVTPGGKRGGAIVALDKKTGKTIWHAEELTEKDKDNAQYAGIIPIDVNGGRQYVQLFMNSLVGVSAEDGKLLWRSEWEPGRTAVIPTPIYRDGHVYITSGYGAGSKLVKIGPENTAEDVWDNKEMKNHHGGVVLVGDHVYGFSDGAGLICQDFKTGEMVWNEKGRSLTKGAVHAADGMLYCFDENEGIMTLAEASPRGFEEKGSFKLPRETELREGTKGKIWAHPVVLHGKLYLRDQDLVFCYDVKG